MPALNFHRRFAEDVEYGIKRQSIRAPRKDGKPHCKVGDELKLYTGMRTKQCRLLGRATVIRLSPVRIEETCMFLDGRPLFSAIYDRDQIEETDNEFARADGFKGFMDMAEWFAQAHGLPFEGTVIYWDHPR